MSSTAMPMIIQGGMGAGVSGWPLARAVARAGQLGVVAGTALDVILARRLQLGDPGGHMRRALEHFPIPRVAARILEQYFVPGGKAADQPFKALPLMRTTLGREREELIVAANFSEVFLAREGHDGPVGINYLEKIQLPTLPSLFGALLAGVGHVLMGAGIPRLIPSVLDELAEGRPVQLPIDVRGATTPGAHVLHFDPASFFRSAAPPLARPGFLAIVASATMANVMARKSSGRVDGLIVEGPTAGGHNAPPRGAQRLNAMGEPIFGERDEPDLEAILRLGLPFWLAGSRGSRQGLRDAQRQGARGVQVGTAFAFCAESGIEAGLKQRVLELVRTGRAQVLTDPLASPTGFPFKVLQLEGSMSEPGAIERREKVCDLGYLRQAHERPDGRLGWRCPGEPDEIYIRKGGREEDIHGRKCVCNGLLANIGLGQVQRTGFVEEPLLTSGSDMAVVAELIAAAGVAYTACDVLDHLLGCSPSPA